MSESLTVYEEIGTSLTRPSHLHPALRPLLHLLSYSEIDSTQPAASLNGAKMRERIPETLPEWYSKFLALARHRHTVLPLLRLLPFRCLLLLLMMMMTIPLLGADLVLHPPCRHPSHMYPRPPTRQNIVPRTRLALAVASSHHRSN